MAGRKLAGDKVVQNGSDTDTYIFFEPDSKQNIVHFNDQKPDPLSFKTTKGATLTKIVEKITQKDFTDDVFVKDFLYTYKDFTTILHLILLLKQRYDGPSPIDSQEKILKFLKEREAIRAKVVSFLAELIPTLSSEDLMQQDIRDILVPFAELIKTNHDIHISVPEKSGRGRAKSQVLSATQMATLRFAFNPTEDVGEDGPKASIDLSAKKAAPLPVITEKNKKLTLRRGSKKKGEVERERSTIMINNIEPTPEPTGPLDMSDPENHAVRIARELTLMEHELLCPVSTWEFLNQAWNKSKKEDMAPNILALTEWFNRSSCWFATKIVAKDTPEFRAAVIETVIDIGMEFLKLNNYSGLMQVLACLNSSGIDRLQQSWALLENKTWGDFQTLNNLMSTEKNFKNYRQNLKDLTPNEPCIPYLGMMLTDYTFMDDNNPNHIDGCPDLINIQRIQLIGAKMREFSNYQSNTYKNKIQPCPEVRETILSERVWDDSEIFRMSKVREETSATRIEPGQGRRNSKFNSAQRNKRSSGSFLGNSATSQESGLSNREWELIMTSASRVQYQTGDVVFQEGILNTRLYRIVEGGIRFEKAIPTGQIVVARIGPGQVFGEMSFLGKNATSATAVADSQSEKPIILSVIETSFIDELFESEHELAATFYKHLAVMVATRLKTTVASATKKVEPPSSEPTSTTTPSSPPSPSPTPAQSPPVTPPDTPPQTRNVNRSPSSPQVPPSDSPAPSPKQSRFSLSPANITNPKKLIGRSPSANSLSAVEKFSKQHTPMRRSSEQLVEINANSSSNLPKSPLNESTSDLPDDTPAEKTRVQDVKFAKRFKNLEDKVVIKVYVCKYGVSGSLYITKNYLCFFGSMLGLEKKKVIPWCNVTNLEKTKHLLVEKTLGVKKTTKRFLFKTAAELDEAYGIISLIWRNHNKPAVVEDDEEGDNELTSSPSSLNLNHDSSRRPSATAISKNIELAVDIPGLPTADDWNVILRGAKAVAFNEGDAIVQEGEKIQKVFQIMRGSCVVQRKMAGTGTVVTLGKMGTHDFFGEISFLLGEGASGTVVAGEGGAEIVALGGDFVNILLSAKPLLAARFFKYLAVLLQKRLRTFQEKQAENK